MNSFNGVKNSWNDYGQKLPYWGVITQSQYETSNISDKAMLDFFVSGRNVLNKSFENIQKYNVRLNYHSALDFGCGVCRFYLFINIDII